MTTLVALLLLGLLAGFGGAFVASAWRGGRSGFALVVATLLVLVVAYLAWLAVMVFGVGPGLR